MADVYSSYSSHTFEAGLEIGWRSVIDCYQVSLVKDSKGGKVPRGGERSVRIGIGALTSDHVASCGEVPGV